MIDETTHSARYEIGGKAVYLRELTLRQMQKVTALDARGQWAGLTAEGQIKLLLDGRWLADVLSAALTDEARRPVTITTDDVLDLGVETVTAMLNDFFGLNPSVRNFLTAFMTLTLSSAAAAAGPTGTEPNSGSISAAAPAAVM